MNENRLKHLPDITIKDASETMFKEINFNKGLTPRLPREISQYYAYGLRDYLVIVCVGRSSETKLAKSEEVIPRGLGRCNLLII